MPRLLEYQGKKLLKTTAISIPRGEIATTPREARHIAEEIGHSVAVKAQVSATGRFKAGGIGFASTPDQAEKVADGILGSNIKGFVVEKVLVEERLDVQKEFYAGLIVDDSYKVKSPVVMFSTRGGVDIEQVASEHPEEVCKATINPLDGFHLDQAETLIRSVKIPQELVKPLSMLVHDVYRVFTQWDARSAEINPIVQTRNGTLYAADCRIVVDDSSMWRHSDLGIDYPREIGRSPTGLEKAAWKIEEKDFRGTAYFVQMATKIRPGEGYVGFHGIGGGGAMLGADALVRHGLKLADYADTSGNPTASKVYRIIKTILSQPNIDGYVLMGAVVANQEQWHHSHALVRALREELAERPGFPTIILIAGNKENESIEILKHGLADLPARVEIYGREYVYNVDYVAERMKTLVDGYNKSRIL